MVKVLVSEFLAGGACAGLDFPESMRREGLSMLRAVATDIARIPGYSVVTTLEMGLEGPPGVEIIRIENAVHESTVFQQLLKQVAAVLVIAPETDGILAGRCRQVLEAGVASWNCSPDAIDLCGDKLRLANHLEWHQIPTIRSQAVDFRRLPDQSDWPIVLKPRDGAGSQLTFLIRHAQNWDRVMPAIFAAGKAARMITQPYIAGRALSVGVNVSFDGSRIEVLPIGEQRLSDDGEFNYLGGRIPARISLGESQSIREVVLATCDTIPGLAGFIGFDLILTEDLRPLVVELNPRLTTSYIGYRRLYGPPLPERWLNSADSIPNPSDVEGFVEFDASEMLNSS